MLSFWQSLQPWTKAVFVYMFVGFAIVGAFNVLYCLVTSVSAVTSGLYKSYFSKKARYKIWRGMTNSPYSNETEFAWFVRTCFVMLGMPIIGRIFYEAHGRYEMPFWTSIMASFGNRKIVGYLFGCKEPISWRRIGFVVQSRYTDSEVEFFIDTLGYDRILDQLGVEDKENWFLRSVGIIGGKEFEASHITRTEKPDVIRIIGPVFTLR